MANAKRDGNRIATLIGVSSSTTGAFTQDTTPVPVRTDPTTKRLLVDAVIQAGFGNQTGVTDGEVVDGDDAGTLVLGTDGSNYQVLSTDSDGHLQIDVLSGGGGGTQYNEDAAHTTGDTGTMALAVRNDTLAALAGTDGDYAPLQVDADGALYTIEKNLVDTNNSTTDVLAGDAVFTGTGTDVTQYATLSVYIEASHDSATDGLQLEFSSDNSNWDIIDSFNYIASDGGIVYTTPTKARYFRFVYTNGSTLQTHFRVQTILHANAQPASDGRLSDSVSPEKIANLSKSAIIAQAAGSGDFVPVSATAGGSLKVDIEEIEGAAGQATMANSLPVVIASDQSAVAVDLGANNDVTVTGDALTSLQLIDDIIYTDDADWTDGVSKHALVGGLYQSTPQTITDGDVAPFQTDVYGNLQAIANGNNGSNPIPIEVDVDGKIVISPISSFVYDTDQGHSPGADGIMVQAVRNDTLASLVNADGDYTPFQVNASGALYIQEGSALDVSAATVTVDLGANNDVTIDGSGVVYADDADWSADTSKHILVGGVTQTTPTANTDGDVTPLTTNTLRELRTAIPESDLATASTSHVKKYYTNAGAVTDGIIWSPGAGKRWYVTDIFINVSAAATVTLEDDLTAGDSAVWKAELAANSGWSHSFNTPLFSGEDAADLLITTSAGNVYVTVTGYEI